MSNPSTSVKKWWNIIKSYYGIKAGISVPPLQEGDSYIFDPKEKADVFNDYFVSQTYYLPANRVQLPTLAQQTNSGLSNISATEDEVFILLNRLDVSKACGADGVSNRMLKLCMNGLGKSLTKLINTSFVLGQFPSAWKLANVLPLYKTENRQFKNNYRPVSLLSCLSKITERLVFNRLYSYLESIGFFYRFQSGFRPGDSTVMQLVYIVHRIHEALDRGNEVRAVFLDISKAFDKVWHEGLLLKLKRLGVDDALYKWFECYLSGRNNVLS